MNELEQRRIEDFIKKLGEEELLYINRLIVSRLKLMDQDQSTQAMSRFNLGDLVEFTGPGGLLRGTIARLNKKTVSVITTAGQQWNVAPQVLREAPKRG